MPKSVAIVQTQRVTVRPWRFDEADRFFDMHRRVEVARWIGGHPMTDRAQATERLDKIQQRSAADLRFGSWAVVERATGILAGSVLLQPPPDGDGEIEIGWHLHPDSWGRGLATEAGRALLAYGFDLGLEEIWAVTHLDNARSVRVCDKLGMQLLGVTERWYHEPSLMFWAGATSSQTPSLLADRPAPARILGRSCSASALPRHATHSRTMRLLAGSTSAPGAVLSFGDEHEPRREQSPALRAETAHLADDRIRPLA